MASSSLYVSFSGFKLKLLLIFVTCLIGITSAQLSNENFYKKNCSGALNIIKEAVKEAVANESRMGASLLRLHFHDCFVQGCDASVLLDDTANFTGEKSSLPNARSIRGLEVIDSIKSKLEDTCPGVVSCADILAVAARDAVVALGGAKWNVPLGRRDSTTANLTESNSDLPGPSLNLSSLIAAFAKKNFNTRELVTLSGAHTVGMVRCNLFRTRIYNESDIDTRFAKEKQEVCPFEGGDFNFTTLDSTTPFQFDNAYYKNLKGLKGLMHSDQQLYGENGVGLTNSQVDRYTKSNANFIQDFAKAMIKMSKMSPLTGTDGEIRKNCRFINPPPTTVS